MPKPQTDSETLSSLLDSFGRSGTSGTYVQMIAARDTLARSGASGVEVTVTPVPDARTIAVATTGPEHAVRPGLEAIIRAAQRREGELDDVWRLQVLESPTEPVPAGITRPQLAGASVLLALIGGLFVAVVLRRFRMGAAEPVDRAPRVTAGAADFRRDANSRVGFELESFRYVRASASTLLMQVTGYWHAAPPRTLADPALVIYERDGKHPIAQIATPDWRPPVAGEEMPLWRGSYAAPLEVVERSTGIALRAGADVLVALPAPVEQSLLSATRAANGHPATRGYNGDHDGGSNRVGSDEDADTTNATSGRYPQA